MLLGRLRNSAILGAQSLLSPSRHPCCWACWPGSVRPCHRPGRIRLRHRRILPPEYVIGLTLILVFSIWWPILPGNSLMIPPSIR